MREAQCTREHLKRYERRSLRRVGHITYFQHATTVGGQTGHIVKCYFQCVQGSVEGRQSKYLLCARTTARCTEVCLTGYKGSVAFAVIGLVSNHPHLGVSRSYGPAFRRDSASCVAAEGLNPGHFKCLARSLEAYLRSQTLLALGAVGTYVELVFGVVVEVRYGSGLFACLNGFVPVYFFAFFHNKVLIFSSRAFPSEGSGFGLETAQRHFRGILATCASGKRYALNVRHINLVCLTILVESDINALTLVGTQINGKLSPVSFKDTVSIITGCL